MEEIRFNLFNSVHKGLRALLADTLMQLQQTDFLIDAQANVTLERIKLVLLLMHRHTKWEEDIVFQQLGTTALSMTNYFTGQHYHTDALTLNMDILICGFEEAKTQAEKEAVANSLLNAFIEFTAYNFNHMNMEEQLINPLLWQICSDRELHELQLLHLNPAERKSEQTFLEWMLIHNTNRELACWLNNIRHTTAATQFDRIYDLAQNVLSAERLEFINLNVYENEQAP